MIRANLHIPLEKRWQSGFWWWHLVSYHQKIWTGKAWKVIADRKREENKRKQTWYSDSCVVNITAYPNRGLVRLVFHVLGPWSLGLIRGSGLVVEWLVRARTIAVTVISCSITIRLRSFILSCIRGSWLNRVVIFFFSPWRSGYCV